MKIVRPETRQNEILISEIPPGTLFVDQDGDLCLKLAGDAWVIMEYKPGTTDLGEDFEINHCTKGERAYKVLKNAVLYTHEDKA
jgi:hypothetical protein